MPTPPVVEDPKNVIFVDPIIPTIIDPQSFPEPPASPVIITKDPEYGTIFKNTDQTFTYVPPIITPTIPVVDTVEFKYTNLLAQTVVVRKEFVLTQEGDVPSIIQTGGSGPAQSPYPLLILIFALASASVIGIRKWRSS